MIGIDASTHIARMANKLPLRYWSSIAFICKAMRSMHLAANFQATISILIVRFVAIPQPAT